MGNASIQDIKPNLKDNSYNTSEMIESTGIIALKRLYDFVLNDVNNEALEGRSKKGRAFGALATELSNTISENGGFYIWGSYTD